MEAHPKIQVTEDHSIFQLIESNRYFNVGHIHRLMDSIKKHDLLRYNPLLVTKEYEVIDGQHRLEAAKRLQVPVSFIVVPDATVEDLHLLNYNMKAWSLKEFLTHYSARGYRSYLLIQRLMKTYAVPPQTAIYVLAQENKKLVSKLGDRVRSSAIRRFKDGNYEATDEEYDNASEFLRQMLDFKPFFEEVGLKFDSAWRNRAWFMAIRKAYEVVDHDTVISKLKMSGKKIDSQSSTQQYLRFLEDVVNFEVAKKNRIRLY